MLLYVQEDENRRFQVFKTSVADGAAEQLPQGGLFTQANTLPARLDLAFALPVEPQPQLLTTL